MMRPLLGDSIAIVLQEVTETQNWPVNKNSHIIRETNNKGGLSHIRVELEWANE